MSRESTWEFPAENDGWNGAHNSIRAELLKLELAPTTIVERSDGNSLDDWRLECVKEYTGFCLFWRRDAHGESGAGRAVWQAGSCVHGR